MSCGAEHGNGFFLVDSAALSGFAESARWSLIPEDLLCAFELVGRVALAHGSGSG